MPLDSAFPALYWMDTFPVVWGEQGIAKEQLETGNLFGVPSWRSVEVPKRAGSKQLLGFRTFTSLLSCWPSVKLIPGALPSSSS